MSPIRPYLLRALFEWIQANGLTPYIVVDANARGLEAPMDYVKDGQIVFNIASRATQALQIGDQWLEFSARFRGVAWHVRIPVGAVLAMYAQENGQGMVLGSDTEQTSTDAVSATNKPSVPPVLKVIK